MIKSVKIIQSGNDYIDEIKNIGISSIAFKSSSINTNSIFVLENTFQKRGGPPKHVHYEQDEWFYCIEGVFIFEIGNEKFKLETGDSILGPKKVPHV
jgi:quercetin dioxygenase-like cupin family protein